MAQKSERCCRTGWRWPTSLPLDFGQICALPRDYSQVERVETGNIFTHHCSQYGIVSLISLGAGLYPSLSRLGSVPCYTLDVKRFKSKVRRSEPRLRSYTTVSDRLFDESNKPSVKPPCFTWSEMVRVISCQILSDFFCPSFISFYLFFISLLCVLRNLV